ncbi:MAG: hypothetical protein R2701_00095 [Acidimicrobiales bacterium]
MAKILVAAVRLAQAVLAASTPPATAATLAEEATLRASERRRLRLDGAASVAVVASAVGTVPASGSSPCSWRRATTSAMVATAAAPTAPATSALP